MFYTLSLAALLGFASLTPALYTGQGHQDGAPSVHEVYSFPVNTSVENLAVRRTGHILANVDSAPELYQIDPFCNDAKPTLIHEFEGYGSLLGIVEVEHDQFYVAAGNFSVFTLEAVAGWWAIFHVDLSSFSARGDGSVESAAIVEKVAEIPEAELLNGLGLFSVEDGLIYAADSGSGIIYLVDVHTGDYWPAIQDPLTIKGEPLPDFASANGVHYNAATQSVYFTNIGQEVFGRVPVFANGSQAGAAEVVMQGEMCDDFLLDDAGNAIIAVYGSNDVIRVDVANGNSTVIAGNANSTELEAVTAVAWGRTARDSGSLYVSRNGGVGSVNVVGGGISRIDL
ncbi:hypothetical protein BD626DRAFT_458868 [Schizophyllum amplum]|uniref:SMP-30/Gluconolactonase/LRE-like region domain-containing protein n=1 Tax=Schizophyllum amplum TaxID=97359 RepID=A0A550CC77_9AGAR|nr:hypothetical protein BD626DRAFT_458868 [Auriculariopsis ampla]